MTFNKEAAAKAYDLVMKMDEDEARSFTTMVVHEVLVDSINKNQRTLERHLTEVLSKRAKRIKRALAKSYMENGPSEELLAAAGALSVISKKKDNNPYLNNGRWDRQEHPFDAETGRFIRVGGAQQSLGDASFDLIGGLGGSQRAGNRFGNAMEGADRGFSSFAHDWNAEKNPQSSTSRLYSNIGAGSEFLHQIAPTSPKAQVAAKFGNFVGQHGHEAEKVFGPPTRKAMYRYRGTERRPDPVLLRETGGGVSRSDFMGSLTNEEKLEYNRKSRAETRKLMLARVDEINAKRPADKKISIEGIKPTTQELAAGRKRADTAFQQEMGAMQVEGRDTARYQSIKYLNQKLPKKTLSDLQLKSGHTAPSEGVIISPNGKVITQAVGYGDDHYLPFNLKNLKGLKGGEYVRTRTYGGPTSEDIYTGLMSGARRLTVISHSGVFTVEFNEDFRGGRRYNQKAARMTDRYEKLLDAVKSKQVTRKPMDFRQKHQIAQEVRANPDNSYLNDEQMRSLIDTKIKEAQDTNRLTEAEETAATQEWLESLRDSGEDPSNPSPKALALQADIFDKHRDRKATMYELNGTGYEGALDALKEQFPYYIKDAKRDDKFGNYGSGTDTGYVAPRHNRPTSAQEGYFDTDVTGTGKFNANRADYQNHHMSGGGVRAEKEAAVSNTTSDAVAATKPGVVNASEVKEKIEDNKARHSFATQLAEFRDKVRPQLDAGLDSDPDFAWLKDDPQELKERMKDPQQKEKILGHVRYWGTQNSSLMPEVNALSRAAGAFGGEKFKSSDLLVVGPNPYKFKLGDGEDLGEFGNTTGITGKTINEMNDDQLQTELRRAISYRKKAEGALREPDVNSSMQHFSEFSDAEGKPLPLPAPVQATMNSKNLKPLDAYIERLHRARALKSVNMNLKAAEPVVPPKAKEQLGKRSTSDDLVDLMLDMDLLLGSLQMAERNLTGEVSR